VEAAATQEGLLVKPPGVLTSTAIEGNLLVATSRELGPSIECQL